MASDKLCAPKTERGIFGRTCGRSKDGTRWSLRNDYLFAPFRTTCCVVQSRDVQLTCFGVFSPSSRPHRLARLDSKPRLIPPSLPYGRPSPLTTKFSSSFHLNPYGRHVDRPSPPLHTAYIALGPSQVGPRPVPYLLRKVPLMYIGLFNTPFVRSFVSFHFRPPALYYVISPFALALLL